VVIFPLLAKVVKIGSNSTHHAAVKKLGEFFDDDGFLVLGAELALTILAFRGAIAFASGMRPRCAAAPVAGVSRLSAI
jgi:hypothetical protein